MSSAKLSIRTNLQSRSTSSSKSPESIYFNNGGGEFVYGQNVIREDLSGLVVDELKRAVRDALEPPSPIGIRATRTVIIRMNMEEEITSETAKQPTVPKPYGAPPVAGATASVATAPVRRHSRSKDDYRCIPVMTSLEENTNSFADSRRERFGAAPPLPQASMSVRIAIGYGREF